MSEPSTPTKKGPLREIVQPFVDLAHSPRAIWGINLPYFLEGFAYFGVLNYLGNYFTDVVGLSEVHAGWMVGVLTFGITIAMFFFGSVVDRIGVRRALIISLFFIAVGRCFLPIGPSLGLSATGMGSATHLVTMVGIFFMVLGYGLYQPGAYAAIRVLTKENEAAMGYAMLYALMNFGAWLNTFVVFIRKEYGFHGAFWFYAGTTFLAFISTVLLLTRRTVDEAVRRADASRAKPDHEADQQIQLDEFGRVSADRFCCKCGYSLRTLLAADRCPECGSSVQESLARPQSRTRKEPFSLIQWFKNHPMADGKFSFFIFCLIPVQTLFAHNWLTLPKYVQRAFAGTWHGDNFEAPTNLNTLLIFIIVPIVTGLFASAKVYRMMILGTFMMGAPAFLLAIAPTPFTLYSFIILMTIGEAMWQPRFLQYAAEIAPEGRTGAYMGVAQFPWFLTKMIVPIYSGWFLQHYCPKEGELNTETMWFIYALIAISSSVMLFLARNWIGKDFKTKAGS